MNQKKIMKGIEMKKIAKLLIFVSVILLSVVTATDSVQSASSKADEKSKVTYSLKNGILTIQGKGKMPKNTTIKNKKKIKKVVIKKGITSIPKKAFYGCCRLEQVSIPKTVKKIGRESFGGTAIRKIKIPTSVKTIGEYAFINCKNLKKVTMPGDIKVKYGDEGSDSLSCNIIETIKFNTDFNPRSAAYFKTNNLEVMKNDSKFQSIDGVVYSKNGKSIVRVPNQRKNVEIISGCTEFCIQSVIYCGYYWEGSGNNGCRKLETITIPETVNSVNSKKYKTDYLEREDYSSMTPILRTKKLKGEDYSEILHYFSALDANKLAEQLPDQIKIADEMCISKDGVLLKYLGKDRIVTVPYGVRRIGSYAFTDCSAIYENVKTVNLSDTITSIGAYAFYNTKIVFSKLPKNLKKIEVGAFMESGGFENNEIVIPDSVQEIEAWAFGYIRWKKLTIPASVKRIGDYAFSSYNNKRMVTVQGKTKNISSFAFCGWYWENNKNGDKLLIDFEKGIKNSQTCLFIKGYKFCEGEEETVMQLRWAKIRNISGYQIQISTNKKFQKNTDIILAGKGETYYHAKMKLNKGTTLYARIRPYKVVKGRKTFGKWTSAKTD